MKIALLLVLSACGSAAVPDPATRPTSFSVEVHHRGAGNPVILIPGLGCPPSIWDATVAHLADREVHVIAFAGFAGRPPIDAPLGATAHDELAAYIARLDHPIVIGHSMGGWLAYWLAVTDPAALGGLVTIDGNASLGAPASPRAVRDQWAGTSDEALRAVYGSMVADRSHIAPYLDAIARSDRATMADVVVEQSKTDLRPRLAGIRVRTLAILSSTATPEVRDAIARVPHHRIVDVPRAKHFVMLDEPSAFHAALDAFLSDV